MGQIVGKRKKNIKSVEKDGKRIYNCLKKEKEKKMPFSEFLQSRKQDAVLLVKELKKHFSYVSVLGTDVRETFYTANRAASMIREGQNDCGFVVKMHKKDAFYEYSVSDISGDKKELAKKILSSVELTKKLKGDTIKCQKIKDEKHVESFLRESDFDKFSDEKVLSYCSSLMNETLKKDDKILNAFVSVRPYTVSKLFVSNNKVLDQHYGWANAFLVVIYKGERVVQAVESANGNMLKKVMSDLTKKADKVIDLAHKLDKAKPIVPGVYDVITDSSITGLIAHEAFGHGVEMDQFVKDRALAKSYVGKYVASPISNMRDGAGATLSAASYFFDDDGVLAQNTQIIKDGILVNGLSDLTSATELKVKPSGNGRRESFKNKAYSRMTNTFFDAGKDKLSDMIKSIKHGYMLFDTNNGMEDPKNWQIQCTAEYGIEIIDGKLTDNYVSPVVMSGSVPELLKSITMISDKSEVIGSGSCGKGYKEWVRVADGGPNLKVRVKLG